MLTRRVSVESISVPVPKEDTVITGKTVVYVPPTTTSGKRGERHFCGGLLPPSLPFGHKNSLTHDRHMWLAHRRLLGQHAGLCVRQDGAFRRAAATCARRLAGGRIWWESLSQAA
jgi:hypothetical protein